MYFYENVAIIVTSKIVKLIKKIRSLIIILDT